MDKGFQKQGDINGTVVEYVLRQILKEEYPIIANTTEKLVEILKDVGLTITSKSIPNFSELIGDFVKEADVKKKDYDFLSNQNIANSEDVEIDSIKMSKVNGVYTLLVAVEIKTTLKLYSVIQLWRQLYLFGRLIQATQGDSKFRLKGVVTYAFKKTRSPENFRVLFYKNTIPISIYFVHGNSRLKSALDKDVIYSPNSNKSDFCITFPKPSNDDKSSNETPSNGKESSNVGRKPNQPNRKRGNGANRGDSNHSSKRQKSEQNK